MLPYKKIAMRFREVLEKRLAKFSLQFRMNKTGLVEFGDFHLSMQKRRQENGNIYFLGFTHFLHQTAKVISW